MSTSTWQIKAIIGREVLDLAPPVPSSGDYDDLCVVIEAAERLIAEGAEAHADLIVIVGENWNGRMGGKAVGLWWTSSDGYVWE